MGLRCRESDGILTALLPTNSWASTVELSTASEGCTGDFLADGRLRASIAWKDKRLRNIGIGINVGGSGGSGFEQSR